MSVETSTSSDTAPTTATFASYAASGFTEMPAAPADGADEDTVESSTYVRVAPLPAADKTVAAKPSYTAAVYHAERWLPREYKAVHPESLGIVLAEHKARNAGIPQWYWKMCYGIYAGVGLVVGVVFNGVSFVLARASARVIDMRNPEKLPEHLSDKILRRAEIAEARQGGPGKVAVGTYGTVVVVVSHGLDLASWLAAVVATGFNSPHRLARLALAVLFVSLIVVGASAGLNALFGAVA
jgi:hypothetical protein